MSTEHDDDDFVELDNSPEVLRADRECFDKMLKALDPTLSVVDMDPTHPLCDHFVLHSHSLKYREKIRNWLTDNMSVVRYHLKEVTYATREGEQVGWKTGETETRLLLKQRPTLAIVRETYQPVACPRLMALLYLPLHLIFVAACVWLISELVML